MEARKCSSELCLVESSGSDQKERGKDEVITSVRERQGRGRGNDIIKRERGEDEMMTSSRKRWERRRR